MKSNSKFKVGDKVRVISNISSSANEEIGSHQFDIGTIGIIEKADDKYSWVDVLSDGVGWSVHPDDLKLITPTNL